KERRPKEGRYSQNAALEPPPGTRRLHSRLHDRAAHLVILLRAVLPSAVAFSPPPPCCV
ncbi:hypothetical protein B0H10DRAFT_2039038, partial [Mycena sp. CBHHK59/15]